MPYKYFQILPEREDFFCQFSKSKDTSYLKAIHNYLVKLDGGCFVVSKSKDTSYLKAIHKKSIKTHLRLSAIGSIFRNGMDSL